MKSTPQALGSAIADNPMLSHQQKIHAIYWTIRRMTEREELTSLDHAHLATALLSMGTRDEWREAFAVADPDGELEVRSDDPGSARMDLGRA
jgi:hypothetical protein